jgi:hypothetical protein
VALGSLIERWPVFSHLDLQEEDLKPEALKVRQRYASLAIDVRRASRAQTKRLAQEIALAAAIAEEAPKDPKTREERRDAMNVMWEAQTAVLDAYRDALTTEVEVGPRKVGPIFARIHNLEVVLEDGTVASLATMQPGEALIHLEEFGLLEPVARAAMRAQSVEEQQLRL